MFRHIRTKFAAAMALPLVVLVGVGTVGVATSLHRETSVTTERALANAALGPSGLVSALQTERNEAGLQLLGLATMVNLGVSSNVQARRLTSIASANFQSTLASSAQARQEYARALQRLRGLGSLRGQTDGFTGARLATNPAAAVQANAVYNGYTQIIGGLIDATSTVATGIADPTLRNGAEILDASLRQNEAQAQVVHDIIFAAVLGGGRPSAQAVVQVGTDLGAYQTWTEQLGALRRAPFGPQVATLANSRAEAGFTAVVESGLAGGAPDIPRLLGTTAAAGANLAKEATVQVEEISHTRAATLATDARNQLLLFVAIAALTAIFGMVIILRVSRSITKPLVRLARNADELATTRLGATVEAILAGDDVVAGDPIDLEVRGEDEVASVARAITALKQSAISLATEQTRLRRNQAAALNNLGRRNQNLVTRQLEYITAVEKDEEDPDKLEQLFRLDHLATRMRRNAESLLVLGGAEAARTRSAPVPAIDVVRSAVSEVEDFRRVRLGAVDPVAIAGQAAADIAHLLAELLENALTSSPPSSQVVVDGELLDGGYRLQVIDAGIGMEAAALDSANERLAGQDSFLEGTSRNLGLYVAGKLAARHEIAVNLAPGPEVGVVATVDLGAELLPDHRRTPAPVAAEPAGQPQSAGIPAPDEVGRPGAGEWPVPSSPSSLQVASAPSSPPAADAAPAPLTAAAALADAAKEGSATPAPPAGGSGLLRRRQAPERSGEVTRPAHARTSEKALPAEPGPRHAAAAVAPDDVAPATKVAPRVAATATDRAGELASATADFESWLNSRLDQLEAMSLDAAVNPTAPVARAGEGDSDGDMGNGGLAHAGLPRRRASAEGAELSAGLLRRTAESSAAGGGDSGQKVNSSLFRYLAAVEQRPSNES